MTLSKESKIVAAVISCAVVICIALTVFVIITSNRTIKTKITFDGEATEQLDVNIKEMYPGYKTEYVIDLKKSKNLYISLNFKEIETSILEEYINVEIKCNDCNINKSLKELFAEKNAISLGTNVKEIKIIYSVPLSAGNEIQDASIDFFIDVTAKREA